MEKKAQLSQNLDLLHSSCVLICIHKAIHDQVVVFLCRSMENKGNTSAAVKLMEKGAIGASAAPQHAGHRKTVYSYSFLTQMGYTSKLFLREKYKGENDNGCKKEF